jgi:hypothetical protein
MRRIIIKVKQHKTRNTALRHRGGVLLLDGRVRFGEGISIGLPGCGQVRTGGLTIL